ncbi:UvrD-helicase domain-containing protein [Bacteroides caecigallinarum]|uniref:ATP-dependent helicase n=1 Tax=Bacteroides caecigallinarum TaxID=1411144 RepID=UPI00195E7BBE|nr:UvrD-helicase domain-containing protein [Bacteroides caecigallinarum]MBM6890962.1 UvrD-helicase domain-containing protein [Bacteroides caecigallinarum]
MTDYLDELNESQRAAVLYNEGPSLVIAGAGSGKTRVLTYKIAYLLDNGYEPWSILALTFTNKAAREMKERISRAVGTEKAKYLWMGTFHSIFARILRTEAAALGYSSNFTIYDSSDSKSLIKSLLKELNLDEKVYKPGLIQSRISNAKNHLISAQAYAASGEFFRSDSEAKIPAMRDIYIRYCERCKQSDAMDFDDLLVNTYLLFKNHPDICEKYADRFRYVLVDEYQDTNFAQHSIVLQLTSKHQRVCVVGDDAQSIYSFRGANIDNILKFTRLYNDARLFKLEQNYRSTQLIVKAANSLIEKNREQIRKEVFSENSVGEPITVTSAYSDVEEGEIVANKITSMHVKNGQPYSDFAILYRTNAQSRIFEEALRKRAVAYRIYGGLSFYQRKEIKDVIAYFRLAVNPHDGEALKRVINYPARGIGDTTLNKIIATAAQEGVSLWTVISSPLDYGLNINKGTHAKLQGFKDIIAEFIGKVETVNAYELGKEIVGASGIMADIIQDTSPEGLSRRENIDELVNGIYDFCDIRRQEGNDRMFLTDYLSEVALLTDQDGEKDDSVPKVTLMTIHSAKGLEFRNVFIVGMEENLFPGPMSADSPRALEEERRLFYVAITRAEENCFISYAKNRYKYGKPEFCNPSRFLKDINPAYLKLPADSGFTSVRNEGYSRRNYERSYEKNDTYRSSGPSMFDGGEIPQEPVRFVKPVPPRNLKRIVPSVPNTAINRNMDSGKADTHGVEVGRLIEHERFGRGEVVRLEGSGDNCKATVRFENAGEKQLLLKFARFKIIG